MPKPTDPTHEQPAECVDPNRRQINWDLLLMHSSYSRPDGFDELLIATFLVKHWEEFKSFLEKMPVKMQMECINWIIHRVDRCAWDKARAEFFENMKLVERLVLVHLGFRRVRQILHCKVAEILYE